MALVSRGFEASVTVLGRDAYPYTMSVPLRSADYATAVTDLALWRTRFAAVSDGVISKYRLAEIFSEDALSLTTAALNSKEVADITVYIDGEGDKKATIFIPMPKDVLRSAATGKARRTVKISETVLITYVGSYQSGGFVSLSDGETAGAMVEGVITSRSFGKAQA